MAYSVETDRKWQKIWEETGLNRFNPAQYRQEALCPGDVLLPLRRQPACRPLV